MKCYQNNMPGRAGQWCQQGKIASRTCRLVHHFLNTQWDLYEFDFSHKIYTTFATFARWIYEVTVSDRWTGICCRSRSVWELYNVLSKYPKRAKMLQSVWIEHFYSSNFSGTSPRHPVCLPTKDQLQILLPWVLPPSLRPFRYKREICTIYILRHITNHHHDQCLMSCAFFMFYDPASLVKAFYILYLYRLKSKRCVYIWVKRLNSNREVYEHFEKSIMEYEKKVSTKSLYSDSHLTFMVLLSGTLIGKPYSTEQNPTLHGKGVDQVRRFLST